ncbi:uncharacterized protein [Diadema setosum]|uniref:uncharacterized protein n=1 Tax=Diadema setosum TaxID=31175 RepID=UPI003B3AB0F5
MKALILFIIQVCGLLSASVHTAKGASLIEGSRVDAHVRNCSGVVGYHGDRHPVGHITSRLVGHHVDEVKRGRRGGGGREEVVVVEAQEEFEESRVLSPGEEEDGETKKEKSLREKMHGWLKFGTGCYVFVCLILCALSLARYASGGCECMATDPI